MLKGILLEDYKIGYRITYQSLSKRIDFAKWFQSSKIWTKPCDHNADWSKPIDQVWKSSKNLFDVQLKGGFVRNL